MLNIKMNTFSFKMIFLNSYFLNAVPKKLFKMNSHSLNSCFGICRIVFFVLKFKNIHPQNKMSKSF